MLIMTMKNVTYKGNKKRMVPLDISTHINFS
jgi:hypothetical protein